MPDFALELKLAPAIVAGCDEVGRGPLAGPVVAAAVIFPAGFDAPWLAKIDDSKKLSEKRRAELAVLIKEHCTCSIAAASVAEIDTLNILQASLLAMHRAIASLGATPGHVLVDGTHIPKNLPCPATSVIRGDSTSLSIAAAAIIAKVHRDALMAQLHEEFPHYGWASNAGYGSAGHMAALQEYGATPHHRASFAPVRDALLRTTA
ncbi:MAG: ribonuclease HII [Bdellovibrionales bacterium]